MSLRVWLPLTKDLRNQGLDDITVTNNGATFNSAGKLGEKYFSAGTITIPASSSNFIFNGTHMSFSFWLKPVGTSGTSAIFGQTSMSAGDNRMYSIFQYPTPNDLHISWQDETSSSTFLGGAWSGFFPADVWTHCCIVYDGKKAMIYRNGELYTTANGTSNRNNFEYDFPIVGSPIRKLNDVRIYDHALSPLEVKHIAQGLILHYPLNRGGLGPTNLLKNGFGELGIENWSYAAGMFSDVPENHPEIYHSYKNVESKEFIPIYRNHNYKFSTWIKTAASSGNSYPSICPYDADKHFIATNNCKEGFDLKTMTILTRELKAGDTKIYVEDLSKWNTNSGHYYDTAAIFGYKDGTGYVWPDGTYTRNCPAFSSGTEAKTNLDKTNNIITLLTAYNGVTIPIGTKICASTYGNTYFYPCGGISYSTITNWTFKENTFSSETPRLSAAKYIRVLAYSNCYQAGMTVTDLTMESFNNNVEYDCSGFGNNGTRMGTFSWMSDTPKYNVSIGITAGGGIFTPMNITFSQYTIAFWAKHTVKSKMLMGSCPSAGTAQTSWYWYGDNSFKYPSGEYYYTHNGGAQDSFKWTHFVATYDGANVRVYRNGVSEGSKACTGDQAMAYLSVGYGFSNSYIEDSNMSDFRIYATALSADDVKSLYNNSAYIDNQGNIYGAVYEEV